MLAPRAPGSDRAPELGRREPAFALGRAWAPQAQVCDPAWVSARQVRVFDLAWESARPAWVSARRASVFGRAWASVRPAWAWSTPSLGRS